MVSVATRLFSDDQLDEVVSLFDQAVSARESRAKSKTDEALAERAKTGEVRQLLLQVIPPALADPAIPDEQVGRRPARQTTQWSVPDRPASYQGPAAVALLV